VQGLSASFGNTVFIALPIALQLFGPAAALPMALMFVVENMMLLPFTVLLLEFARAGSAGPRQVAGTAVNAMIRNPVITSVLVGGAAALAELELPALATELIALARGAAVPCALFALGATMAGLRLTDQPGETVVAVAVKLLAYPLVVLGVLLLAPGLDPTWRAVAVLAACMPMGANVYLIAATYHTYVARASTGVLVSTAVSVATVSAVVV